MKGIICSCIVCWLMTTCAAQPLVTTFEQSEGKETATYFECIRYYKQLDAAYNTIRMLPFDTTDAGYPLHLVLFSSNAGFNPNEWRNQHKVVIMINNGIHPGEPDGIDASMMLLRDLASRKIRPPANVVLAVIPVYNIGGCLNRSSFYRANQNGPTSYGFRGNAQNLDLNRDFIKADSKDAIAFEKIFHWLDPDILIDNHVSDGADYQHTMTLLTTQHDKLGGDIGSFLHNNFEPAVFKGMETKGWPMCPYVNFEDSNPEKGWEAFYDPPRYSSGYAALFQTMSFVPETHMLKPFKDRVQSTYALMQTMMEQASLMAATIIEKRNASIAAVKSQQTFALSWQPDTTHHEMISFMGYQAATRTSEVTGFPRLYYDHGKPFTAQVKYFNTFSPVQTARKPAAYIIPEGWHEVIRRLRLNGVLVSRLAADTSIEVEIYHVDDYKTLSKPYEKHHKNYLPQLSISVAKLPFLKGSYIIFTGQRADRYIVETLEPGGDDSFFSWNFFDAVLQQKEGYSDYRWEDLAASFLQQQPELHNQLKEKKNTDTAFAASPSAQLEFVYRHSPWYEPSHMRYPVYRKL